MKRFIGFSILMISSLFLFLFCGDKITDEPSPERTKTTDTTETADTTENTEIRPSIVGEWEEEIPVIPSLIPVKLLVNLSILSADSSFLLSVVETDQANNDTLYKHSGTWRLGKSNTRSEDSLYLFGKECHLIDTTADPDTMIQMANSIAEQTIVLDTSGTGSGVWKIKLSSLTPFMSSMLPPLVVSVASTMELEFERKEMFFSLMTVDVQKTNYHFPPIFNDANLPGAKVPPLSSNISSKRFWI
jgi:hypothetical protein